jgi:hypothetical protein
VLKAEKGTPLCQNAVPDTCHPFSTAPNAWLRILIATVYILSREILPDIVVAQAPWIEAARSD